MTTFESLARRRGGAILLSLFLVACDTETLLQVPDPDVATPESVLEKANLPAVLAGALGDFMVAYNGTGDGQISMSALFTDELIWAETFPTRFEVDVRSIALTNSTMEGVFRNLHRARISALRAKEGYLALDATNVVAIAEALNLEALTHVYFGENYCNGVPFSRLSPTGAEVYGSPQSNVQMFNDAIAKFDSAITILGSASTTAANNMRYFAQVGRGRALMNLDQHAQAATAVAGVPTTFSYSILHSENSARQNNGLFNLVYDGRRFSVGQVEGGNGLPYQSDAAAGDTRVPNTRLSGTSGTGFDGNTPLFSQQKYAVRSAAAPVINGTEARLIEAEANYRAGGVTWITTLNNLRTAAGLPGNLVIQATPAANEDIIFKERAYWLWLTSHRLGDMRRLIRHYGRSASAVFPSGSYFKGGLYGPDVNFPIPFDEKNNPNFVECTNRDA